MVFNFFFNPFGLGPEPEIALPDEFISAPANSADIVRLLVDGKEAFAKVLELINKAKESIIIQTFIWKDDQTGREIAAAVMDAARRGVKVEICKDMVGTFFELQDMLKGKLSPVFGNRELITDPNIKVVTSVLRDTDHSKYFIIDSKYVVCGGMNIADEYRAKWHDYMIYIDSPKIAQAFEKKAVHLRPWDVASNIHLATNNKKVTEIHKALLETINRAQNTIVLEHAYFSKSTVIEALAEATVRGVHVTVILPKNPGTHFFANQATINKLLEKCKPEKLDIYHNIQMTHAKVGLVDNSIAIIGSANLTPRSMVTCMEIAIFVKGDHNHPVIARLNERLGEDIVQAEKVTDPFRLSLYERILAWVGKYTY